MKTLFFLFSLLLSACFALSQPSSSLQDAPYKLSSRKSSSPQAKAKGISPHPPSFTLNHKWEAGDRSNTCASCHLESQCLDCHDGRVKPQNIHSGDYLTLHAMEAKSQVLTCTNCHQTQSFCLSCHQRLGISQTAPLDVIKEGGGARVHPAKSEWTEGSVRPGHHGFMAKENLSSCTSCHVERDCTSCHASLGIGGGVSPHKSSFVLDCVHLFNQNPRPCYVCHASDSSALQRCR